MSLRTTLILAAIWAALVITLTPGRADDGYGPNDCIPGEPCSMPPPISKKAERRFWEKALKDILWTQEQSAALEEAERKRQKEIEDEEARMPHGRPWDDSEPLLGLYGVTPGDVLRWNWTVPQPWDGSPAIQRSAAEPDAAAADDR